LNKAVVLLSGGLDSATALAIARSEGYACYCLSLDYGQRHSSELDAAHRVAVALDASEHRTIKLDLTAFGGSALTDDKIAVPTAPSDDIPVTYVPARNTIMLSLALAWAEVLDSHDIFIGANAVDYSGYPDCRPEYLNAFEKMANLATKSAVEGQPVRIRAPLVDLSKAEIIRRGIGLGVDYSLTVSCYQANDAGLACGQCDSCRLRHQGFLSAGVPDPTGYIRPPN
jgi:7-cyano-7-deazaguanine synthase